MDNLTETYISDSICLLKEMVAIPSPSFKEDAVCSHICRFLDRHAIAHLREGNNIIALNRYFDPAQKSMMLCAHIDTVPPCEEYSFDPYIPDYDDAAQVIPQGREKSFICGLGSNDDGASVVSMTAAFRHFYNERMPINLILVLTSEEERSGKGGMDHVWLHFPQILGKAYEKITPSDPMELYIHDGKTRTYTYPAWAIAGEPTGMEAATSERGLLVIDAVAEGISGHAARNEGVNAIYKAIEDIKRLRSYTFDKVSPTMGEVKLNVTQINAGTAHNIIPDRCTFVVDIRPTEMYTNKEILDALQSVCGSRLTARNLSNRSSATPESSYLLKCLKDIRINTFSSPTTSDWMRIPCEAIKMGPGDSSRSHKKDEYVYTDEIKDAVGIYIEFIENFCKNYC